jgi:DNA repair and recombination RAD54-like protein
VYGAKELTNIVIDGLIESVDTEDGVKARFFPNILSLANAAGEILLAFSHTFFP